MRVFHKGDITIPHDAKIRIPAGYLYAAMPFVRLSAAHAAWRSSSSSVASGSPSRIANSR
jgi:hypothetical protein